VWKRKKLLLQDTTGISDRLTIMILTENKTIPIIVTDERDSIVDHANLDSVKVAEDPGYVQEKIKRVQIAERTH
jgi:hypothetical protein